MTLTTTESAELLGVSERRVRQLVAEGKLEPIGTEWTSRRGRAPMVFRLADVAELEHRTRRRSLATLAAQWRGA